MNDDVLDAVKQWQVKAESDWTSIEILQASEQCPADVVCFHCQQFVEKLLKGLLTLHGVEAPRTHDLRRLIQLAEPFAPALSSFSDRADALTHHGVQARYPDDWCQIQPAEMSEMIDLAKEFGDILMSELE